MARRRRIGRLTALIAAAALLMAAGVASAHITGVFLYFLKDVQGQAGVSSAAIMATQIKEADQRIQALEPQVAAAQKQYQANQARAAASVRFYNRYAANGFAALLADSHDPIDALADLHIVQRTVSGDITRLQALADEYRRLSLERAELVQWRALLGIFRDAEERFQKTIGIKDDQQKQLALYDLSESWEQIRTGPFARYFAWANRQLARVASQADASGPQAWRLSEDALNALIGGDAVSVDGARSVHVFLRADHVYVTGVFASQTLGERQVIAVGQMSRAGARAIHYRLEYVLVDGYLIDPNDPQLQETIKDVEMLHIDGRSFDRSLGTLQFEQENGDLLLRARA